MGWLIDWLVYWELDLRRHDVLTLKVCIFSNFEERVLSEQRKAMYAENNYLSTCWAALFYLIAVKKVSHAHC